MKGISTFLKTMVLMVLFVLMSMSAFAGGKIEQDQAVTDLSQRIANLQNKADVIKYQWYDIYADGLVPGADDAAIMIVNASAGSRQQAAGILVAGLGRETFKRL